jgi:hypothetical protein
VYCFANFDGKHIFGALEGLTCIFVVPIGLIAGMIYGTQDKDLWT